MRLKDWLTGNTSATGYADTETTTTSTTTTIKDNNNNDILLMDGGVSTHLETLLDGKGFPIRELWSSSLLMSKEGQSTILKGHKDWIQSGSNIITTVTYQCHFGVDGITTGVVDDDDTQMKSMISTGIKLAKQAASEVESDAKQQKQKIYVVGSSGCYGAALADGSEYTGNYGSMIDLKVLEDFHRRKIDAFLSSSSSSHDNNKIIIDGIAIETIPNLLEIEAVCNVIIEKSKQEKTANEEEDGDNIAYWISLACCDGSTLNDKTPIQEALDLLQRKDPFGRYIHGIGINCCDSLYVGELVKTITNDMITNYNYSNNNNDNNNNRRRGIIIYPNSGEEWDATNETWKSNTGIRNIRSRSTCCGSGGENNNDNDTTFDDIGSTVFTNRLQNAIQIIHNAWKNNNNNPTPPPPPPRIIIGGCCRTTPSEIQSLRKWIDERKKY